MQPIVKASISVLLMLGVAPIAAVITLVFGDPERWSESQHPLRMLGMAFFGLFTTPLWPTYIPAIILTPLLMHKLSQKELFWSMPVAIVLTVALLTGALMGVCVMMPIILMELEGNPKSWVMAGAVSGSVTLGLVSIVYRSGGRPKVLRVGSA